MTTVAVDQKVEQVQEVLERIQSWPHWPEIALGAQKEYGLSPEQFEERLPEFQRFLALCSAYSGIGMTSEAIDQLWHASILNTRRYDELCDDVIGRKIHHLPCSSYSLYGVDQRAANSDCTTCQLPSIPTTCYGNRYPNEDVRQSIMHSGQQFRDAYHEVFGELPAIWYRSRQAQPDGVAV